MKFLKHLLAFVLFIMVTSCVQKTHPKTITVVVDMNAVENVSNVGIRGGSHPLSWEETSFLLDVDGDGFYKTTFELHSASFDIEFKFVTNDTVFELQDQNNRSITFKYKPETIIYEAAFNNPQHTITKH